MAGKIVGITIDIEGDSSGLTKSLKEVDKSLDVGFVKSKFLIFYSIDYANCIKDMRKSYRSIEVIAQCFVNTVDECLDLSVGSFDYIWCNCRNKLAIGKRCCRRNPNCCCH